jgi:hypothetical protein
MVYEAPDDRTKLLDPTPEQLAAIFLRTDHSYWLQGGNGEAAIRLVKEHGDVPWLWIKSPEPRKFFFAWIFGPEGNYSPFDDTQGDGCIEDECGGDPFWLPRCCLVNPTTAVEIASHFVRTRDRSPTVSWREWQELPDYPGACPYCFKSMGPGTAERCASCGVDWKNPPPPSCPHCGTPLKNADDKRCLACGAEWYGMEGPPTSWGWMMLLVIGGAIAGLLVRLLL